MHFYDNRGNRNKNAETFVSIVSIVVNLHDDK